ncbi:MAG: hypothetical protein D6790_00800 [Caldilineae bacterium]|nr:MAG: hypothetical protein D6790_00800 [Caldilineae bacterium]
MHRCGGNCRPDVMLALPFLLEIEMHKTEIAKLFGIKPTQVIKEIEHLLEEKERDKNTLRRKLALVRNHVYHNTGINIPMPTMA